MLGFEWNMASDGLEALDMWHAGEYALLLTDLHMPEMDGYTLTTSIRNADGAGSERPIVALTANALKDESAHCLNLGMNDYLSKPVELKDLEEVLERWLQQDADSPASTDKDTQADDCVLDVSILLSLIGDDREIADEFLVDFRNSLATDFDAMTGALRTQNLDEVSGIAHRLKSAARGVGALLLGQCCEALEFAAKESDLTSSSKLLAEFEFHMSLVNNAIARELAAESDASSTAHGDTNTSLTNISN